LKAAGLRKRKTKKESKTQRRQQYLLEKASQIATERQIFLQFVKKGSPEPKTQTKNCKQILFVRCQGVALSAHHTIPTKYVHAESLHSENDNETIRPQTKTKKFV